MQKIILLLTLIFVAPLTAMHRVAQVVRHMALQQPLSQRLHTVPASTLDHLSYAENNEAVKQSLGKGIAEHKNLLKSITHQEELYKKNGTHRVMYHNCNCKFRVLHDLYAFAYEHTTGKPLPTDTVLMRHWSKGSSYNNAQDFLDACAPINDNHKEVFSVLLAVNFSLTGNSENLGESTLSYFFRNESIALLTSTLTLEQTFRELCDLYNIHHSHISELMKLTGMVTTKEGNILQITMPHELVNKYIYCSQPGGIPSLAMLKKDGSIIAQTDFDSEKKRYTATSNVLKELFDDKTQRDNIDAHSVDSVQGRILLTNEGMLNPQGPIRIKRYTTLSPEQEAAYTKKAHALFTEMFKEVPRGKQPAGEIFKKLNTSKQLDVNHLEVIDAVIEGISVEPNIADYAAKGDWEKVRELVEQGKDVNATTQYGSTALEVAIDKLKYEIINLLIERGAKISHAALSNAIHKKRTDLVKLLLASITQDDINKANYLGKTPLHRAVESYDGSSNSQKIIQLLLDHGADCALQDINGLTPLHIAIRNSPSLVKFMIDICNIDPNLQDKNGNTILHDCCIALNNRSFFSSLSSCIDYLIKHHKIKVNLQNIEGLTPLHIVINHQYHEITRKLLVEGQADPNIQDNLGRVPLYIAIANASLPGMDYTTIIKFMLHDLPKLNPAIKVNVNLADFRGITPLHRAVQQDKHEIVKILLEHGADPFIGVEPHPDFTFTEKLLPIHIINIDIKMKLLLARYMYPTIKKNVTNYCKKQSPHWQQAAAELAEISKLVCASKL